MKYEQHKKHERHSNGDGYITRDGHTMMQFDIVRDLRRKEWLEAEVERLAHIVGKYRKAHSIPHCIVSPDLLELNQRGKG